MAAPFCRRCFLYKSLKIFNILILLFGVCLIIYSLWLNSKWIFFTSHLFPTSLSPRPWFIYTCLGVGIAVCLSSLSGSIVSNYLIATSTLCVYILIISCLLLVEAAAVDLIFFHTNLEAEITAYAGGYVEEIEMFVKFHVQLSRVMILVVLIAQTNAVVIAVIFWAICREPRSRGIESNTSQFTESFLVPIRLPQLVDTSTQPCLTCGNVSTIGQS